MPTVTQPRNLGDLLKYEAPNLYSRDQDTVAAAQNLPLGTVVGRETATAKLKALDLSATDGTETAVGVLGNDVDATLIDREDAILIARHANAYFIEKNGRVLLMAENIAENSRQLTRFKRAERGRTGAKQIKRGQEIPIAVLVKRVDLKRRLNLAGGVQRALPALARAIQQELDKV